METRRRRVLYCWNGEAGGRAGFPRSLGALGNVVRGEHGGADMGGGTWGHGQEHFLGVALTHEGAAGFLILSVVLFFLLGG